MSGYYVLRQHLIERGRIITKDNFIAKPSAFCDIRIYIFEKLPSLVKILKLFNN